VIGSSEFNLARSQPTLLWKFKGIGRCRFQSDLRSSLLERLWNCSKVSSLDGKFFEVELLEFSFYQEEISKYWETSVSQFPFPVSLCVLSFGVKGVELSGDTPKGRRMN